MNRQQRRAEKRAAKKKGRNRGIVDNKVKQDYNIAVDHHNNGRTAEAAIIYKSIIDSGAEHTASMHNLGLILMDQSDPEQAIKHFKKAIEIKPDYAQGFNSLGAAMFQMGRNDEALTAYRQSLELNPDNAQTHYNIGNALVQNQQPQEAMSSFQQALRLDPTDLDSQINIGSILMNNDQLEDAATCFQNIINKKPRLAEAHYNLGLTYEKLGRLEDASESLSEALAIKPGYVEALNNQGSLLQKFGKKEEAESHLRKAIALKPDFPEAYYNLGVTFEKNGDDIDAIDCYEKAIEIKPDYADAHCGLSTVLLAQGDLKRGWQEYEWRWDQKSVPIMPRHFPQPRWNGEDLQGKSILLWGEQGIGDEMRFASMVPDIMALGAQCTIECEPRLVDLFARSFPGVRTHAFPFTQAESGEEAFDYQIPMGSLHAHFRTCLDDFPDRKSYLVPDEQQKQKWHERISALGDGLKVGVSWRSSLVTATRRVTFANIADLEPILALKDAVFVNLQYGECGEEIAEFQDRYGVPLHAWDDIDLKNDIDDAMALTANLDVVITLVTAVYEMSGSLGVPTYTFFPPMSCFLSMGTDGIPFHQSVRLYKSRPDEDWQRVLREITEDVGKL